MYKFIANIKIKNASFNMHYDFSLWGRKRYSTLYMVNFNKYAKFKNNEIEVDMELLNNNTDNRDRYNKYLWYMLPINEKNAYCIVPFLNEQEILDFVKQLEASWDMLSVDEYIIKNIIE